ncbi:hypothetical protein Tco_1455705 [Tanacetum coccineum]
MHTRASNSELVEPLLEPERTLNQRRRRQNRRVPFNQRNNPPKNLRIVYPPILDINHFRHFLVTLKNIYPMDDEPMWATDRVVAPTSGFAITIPETANEFAIKRNSMKQIFDKRTKNEAKNDKTEHGMEEREKDKVKIKVKVNPDKVKEQVVNLDTYTPEPLQYRNIPICYDDDDDEYSFATQEYLKKFSFVITPDLPKSDSLIMEDEHLDTIPETKSDELIKSSVEDLVHTPSESDGISEGECDLSVYDDSSPKKDEVLDDIISIPPRNGNDHFNVESSPIESVLNRDNVISSPKIDLLIEEFAGELALIAPIPSGIVEADLDLKGDIRFIEHLMYDNSFPRPLETLKDDSETVIDSNNDYSLSDDDSYKDIDYVDVSPPDSELVSLEEVKDFHTEDGEIEDDILHEKLSKINLLFAKIEALNTNPTPSSDFVTKSSSTFLNLFLEETNTFDNSLPKSKTFCFNLEEISSGSTTTRFDLFFPDYEAFYSDDDHINEKSSGSTTTHADFSQYDSFIFDLLINLFPPTDRSDFYHEEFADELTHIISPPDLECFYFKIEPDPGDLIDPGIRENLSSTTNVNLPFEDAQSPLFAYVVWIFLAFLTYPVSLPYLLFTGNEDTIFDPGISIYHSFMPSVSHRSGTFMKFNVYPNHLNESLMEILSSTCSPMDQ